MMFGREARYPVEIPEDYRVDNSVEDNLSVEEVTENILKRDEVIQAVLSSKRDKNSKGKTTPKFHVGMKVWQLNVRSQQRKGGKLDSNYLRPYTIVSITGKSVDLQDNQGVIKHKINMDRLMLYSEEKPRMPRKTYEVPSSSTSPQVSS
ncbi:hypothetical protein ATANTOWER_028272 [Ataeniobius toweri]|uniref:Reverse transcriptase n=1 Tax=Ataeniobius toweri TaxID=208326 RepID=A0ABU7C9W8_9TELE|nr:hypothetical protein [Ataeniobius toweri]